MIPRISDWWWHVGIKKTNKWVRQQCKPVLEGIKRRPRPTGSDDQHIFYSLTWTTMRGIWLFRHGEHLISIWPGPVDFDTWLRWFFQVCIASNIFSYCFHVVIIYPFRPKKWSNYLECKGMSVYMTHVRIHMYDFFFFFLYLYWGKKKKKKKNNITSRKSLNKFYRQNLSTK